MGGIMAERLLVAFVTRHFRVQPPLASHLSSSKTTPFRLGLSPSQCKLDR
jgi:hypothetical protein